jgi:meso-butanediol dehydrogenase/(S,S)-butanediol dehydrogenase/diacetyl reductase
VALDLDATQLTQLSTIDGVATRGGDVATEETNVEMVLLATRRFGRLDAAVLNAGAGGTLPLESDGAIDRLDRILGVNVRGVALGIRSSVRALRAAGGGAIVVTASVSGLRGDPGVWAYNASKAAAINLVHATAIDYAAQNIRINALAPGLIATERTADLRGNPSLAEAALAQVPMHRWGNPREQAEAVWFLASPAASFITGTTLIADGGLDANTGLVPPPFHNGLIVEYGVLPDRQQFLRDLAG